MQMRCLLIFVFVFKVEVAARIDCKQYDNNCAGCLAVSKYFAKVNRCSYCIHVDPKTGEQGHAPKCTSHPVTARSHLFGKDSPPVCPYGTSDARTGWAHINHQDKTKNRDDTEVTQQKCSSFTAEKEAEARRIKADVKNSAPEGLMKSPGGHLKALISHYNKEKSGTVIEQYGSNTLDTVHFFHGQENMLMAKYLDGYLPRAEAENVPVQKRLSFSAFAGRVRHASRLGYWQRFDEGGQTASEERAKLEEAGKTLNNLLGVQLDVRRDFDEDEEETDEKETGDWIKRLVDAKSGAFRIPVREGEGGVAYLDEKQRQDYEYKVEDGRIVKSISGHLVGAAHLDTCHMRTYARGNGWAIYVVAPDGRFYTASHNVGAFHHSSFLSGEPALAAGEWLVKDGKIVAITDKTGHYQMGAAHLAAFLFQLQSQGADMHGATAAHYSRVQGEEVWYALKVAKVLDMKDEMTDKYEERMRLKKEYDDISTQGNEKADGDAAKRLEAAYDNFARAWDAKIAGGADEITPKFLSAKAEVVCPKKKKDLERVFRALTSARPFALQPAHIANDKGPESKLRAALTLADLEANGRL